MSRSAGARVLRRRFLGWVSASLPALVSCNDEPIEVTPPASAPIDHHELLREYFGDDGLDDAEAIGNYHAQFRGLTPTEAFEATASTRALIDASVDVAHALTVLDQRVIDDFLELELVDVAGWTLSATEVDLCLMAWLD